MDARQIERYLGFLGQKLDEMQTSATIILLGGALKEWVYYSGHRSLFYEINIRHLTERGNSRRMSLVWCIIKG